MTLKTERLGAVPVADGVQFSLYSSVAERIELCLFTDGKQSHRFDLEAGDGDVWSVLVEGARPGQRYGYRVHGPFDPDQGHYCNPAKLLIDPWARQLDGEVIWDEAIFPTAFVAPDGPDPRDSADFIPKCVVREDAEPPGNRRVPWAETIFYELNVRGYTMRHPALDDATRGRFAGLTNAQVLDYLKSLGVTSIELMPVQYFVDEHHLAEKGLRNFWGYNSLGFFAPAVRYGQDDPVAEFRDMVRTLHDAGFEVILDVVYNHTAESGRGGPLLSFRGIDNLAYYRVDRDFPGEYLNDTGCGNTLNADSPIVQRLVLDSLRYWARDMGVDGFRFDLAPVLGRHETGFASDHPLLRAMAEDPVIAAAKLIAEPWDAGPGGYQLGRFGPPWAEWNDRFRDSVRRFWRGDDGLSGEFARRLRGSADLFEHDGRKPTASVNFVACHDGFTLADIASYERRHNLANGEGNRDGHAHNYGHNHGVEGPTDDPDIVARRRRHRLNLVGSLLLSQGTPLLLAGDEFGHTQFGNNNAYAQDNETAWLDWSRLESEGEFLAAVRELIAFRKATPLVHLGEFLHGRLAAEAADVRLNWINPDSGLRDDAHWESGHAFGLLLDEQTAEGHHSALALLFNAWRDGIEFELPPAPADAGWQLIFSSALVSPVLRQRRLTLDGHSLALLTTA